MKREYIKPEMDLIKLRKVDIITASGDYRRYKFYGL